MMKKVLILISAIMYSFSTHAQPNVIWTKTYADSAYSYSLIDAIQDNLKNTIVLARALKISNLDKDPILIKYDPAGNLILNWTHSDSVAFETPIQVLSDSINNLYLLTVTGNMTADSTHLIKIDGITGQELYKHSFGNSFYGINAIGITDQYLYLALGTPVLQLYKYDLQGNLIWNKPIPKVHKLKKIHFFNEYVYLIGDTISSTYFVDIIQKFDSSGTLQWQTATLNAGSYNYMDSEIDYASNLWISGYTSGNIKGYLSKIDSTGALWDTLLPPNSAAGKITINNQGDIFWVYSVVGATLAISKMNASGNYSFASVDTNGGNHDLNCLYNGDVMFATTRKGLFFDRDYEISSFASNGNLNWNLVYSHTPNSIENVFRLFADSNYAFLVGEKKDSASGYPNINVLRIDFLTAITDFNLTENSFNNYPNPVIDDQINFNLHFHNVHISLYDCYGRLVYHIDNFNGSNLALPDNLKSGLYVLEIFNEKILFNIKIIIQ